VLLESDCAASDRASSMERLELLNTAAKIGRTAKIATSAREPITSCAPSQTVPKVHGCIISPHSTYFGEIRDGIPNGTGRIILGQRPNSSTQATQIVLDGEFINGALEGLGTMCSTCDGKVLYSFRGMWSGGARNGFGYQVYGNGSQYSGRFVMGKKHGIGLCIWPNGDSFFGYFNKGTPDGMGEARFSDGSIFRGMFKNHVLSGIGEICNGSERVVGLFSNGSIEEIYAYSCAEENIIYKIDEGDYNDAEPDSAAQAEEEDEDDECFLDLRGMRSPHGRRPCEEEEGKQWSSDDDEDDDNDEDDEEEGEEEEEEEEEGEGEGDGEGEGEGEGEGGEEERRWRSEDDEGSAEREFASEDAIDEDFELAKHILRYLNREKCKN
jgi:hypothetical protein